MLIETQHLEFKFNHGGTILRLNITFRTKLCSANTSKYLELLGKGNKAWGRQINIECNETASLILKFNIITLQYSSKKVIWNRIYFLLERPFLKHFLNTSSCKSFWVTKFFLKNDIFDEVLFAKSALICCVRVSSIYSAFVLRLTKGNVQCLLLRFNGMKRNCFLGKLSPFHHFPKLVPL